LIWLEPGASRTYDLKLEVLTGEDAKKFGV
jgi:hypothetical protein